MIIAWYKGTFDGCVPDYAEPRPLEKDWDRYSENNHQAKKWILSLLSKYVQGIYNKLINCNNFWKDLTLNLKCTGWGK